MSRRQDGATATVGAGLTAGGGYLRHQGVKRLIKEQGGKEPKVHGLAVVRRGSPGARKLYAGGALIGLVGAPALGIGGTRFVRGDRVAKMGEKLAVRYTNALYRQPKVNMAHPVRDPKAYKAGQRKGFLRSTGNKLAVDATPALRPLEYMAKRDPNKPTFLQEGVKGTLSSLNERKDTLVQRDVPTRARAAGLATTGAAGGLGVLAARTAMRGSSAGRKALVSPVVGVLAGAAATPLSSRVVDRVSPGYVVTASGVKRKKKAPKRPSSSSYTERAHPRSFQSDIAKYEGRASYRAKVTAAGMIPVVGYGTQAGAARTGIKSLGDKNKASATQASAAIGGDIAGGLAGMHGAAYLARKSPAFARRAEGFNTKITDSRAALRSSVGLKPKVLKPAGAGGGRAGTMVRRATSPLKGKYGAAAAVGGLGGSFLAGNAAQQGAITRNHRRYVSKSAPATGMTRREEQKQLRNKTRLIAINTMGATAGGAGLATFTASRMARFAHKKPQLEAATLGLGAVGGGIGSYGGFKRAKVEYKDVKSRRKALGVSKGMPDQSVLRVAGPLVPAGLRRAKSYQMSTLRRTPTGTLTRVKAGVR